jgi:CHAT domain-containing protein
MALAVSHKQWDDLLELSGAPDQERMDVLERALCLLDVGDLPNEVLDLASRLGGIHSERGDWAGAARAFTTATRALDWIHRELFTETSQIRELSGHYKLVELAAYAVARAGRPDDAVVMLENGRTRGLAADLVDDSAAMARVRATMPALAAEVDRLRRALRELGRGVDPGGTGNRLRADLARAVARVREVDGLGAFLADVRPEEIAEASRPDSLLVYLLATPSGSMVLLVEPAPVLSTAVLLSEVTSNELVTCLNRAGEHGPRGVLKSSGADLDEEIHRAQQVLGRAFGQSLLDAARARGASAVHIVPSGILATLPVTTALVSEPGRETLRPLSSALTVSLAPSARVHQVCRDRARRRATDPVRLVCAADPEFDVPGRALRWARREARAIGRLYGAERSRVAEGAAANRAFVVENVAAASHLHLALHGRSDAAEAMQSGIGLADGVMTAAEFRRSTTLAAKVAVVSACESGRISIGQAPNEFRGLPFALIACGAAGVVAALWPVEDRATSVLMVRFHEELVRLESAGAFTTDLLAEALQVAQNWLRTATVDDVAAFMARHALHADTEPADTDRTARDLAGRTLRAEFPAGAAPFGAPQYWAGFVAIA